MPSLPEIQRKLAKVFTHPHGVQAGLAAAGFHRKKPVTAIVADRPPVPLHARLAVYSDAYFLRLAEGLGQDFPAVRRALGAGDFQRLAADYLMKHPSRSPFINDAGAALPAFLKRHPFSKKHLFLPELAALERTVLRALFTDRLPATPLAGLGPSSRLRLDPTASLMETAWAVDHLWEKRRSPPVKSARLRRPEPRRLLVHRDAAWVRVRALAPEEHLVLKRLGEGKRLSAALKGLTASPARLRGWFARWTRDGTVKGAY